MVADPIKKMAVEEMVLPILRCPTITTLLGQWTIQGLGMLRCRINDNLRLHIWHSDIKTPNIENSAKHTHAWDFHSYVVAGQLRNYVYERVQPNPHHENSYMEQEIECGADGCTMGEPSEVYLAGVTSHVYRPGDTYFERGEEIHETRWQDTTVTLIHRVKKQGKDIAKIFIPVDHGYVAAPSMPATWDQVCKYTRLACARIEIEAKHAL